jgi:hypothetical protein
MRAIKKVRKQISNKPKGVSSLILAELVLCLEEEKSFDLKKLYELKMDDFELALEVLKEWRLDRYYEGKAKLIDVAIQASEMHDEQGPQSSTD